MNENDYLVEDDSADADPPALANGSAANVHAKKKRKMGDESAVAVKGKVCGASKQALALRLHHGCVPRRRRLCNSLTHGRGAARVLRVIRGTVRHCVRGTSRR